MKCFAAEGSTGSAAREASRQARRLPKRVKNAGAKEAACQNGSWRPLKLPAPRATVLITLRRDGTASRRYLHLNPVRAKLVRSPEEWRWSSYAGYRRRSAVLDWVSYERVLGEFGADPAAARRSYVQFVRAGIDDPPVRPWKNAFGGLIVGSEVFASRVRRMLEGRPAAADVPQLRVLRPRPDLKRIAAVVAEHFGECGADWTAGRRSDDAGRAVAAYLARRRYGYRATEVAATLGYRVHSSVTMAVARVEAELARLRGTLKEIENQLAVDN